MNDNGQHTLKILTSSPGCVEPITLLLNRYPHLVESYESVRDSKKLSPVPLLLETLIFGFPETVDAILDSIKKFTNVTNYGTAALLSAITSPRPEALENLQCLIWHLEI